MTQDQLTDERLTPLQQKILFAFWNRRGAKRIASDLGISEAWVNKNLAAVRKELGVNSSSEAAEIVFGSKTEGIKDYYYQKTVLQSGSTRAEEMGVDVESPFSSSAQSSLKRINNLGVGTTLLAICAVAICVVGALALIVQAILGLHQLWNSIGY